MRVTLLGFYLFSFVLIGRPGWAQEPSTTGNAPKGAPALNRGLRPAESEDVLDVFRDTVVVQRKAMPKANRFLLSTYGSMDFSDGPYTMYGFHVNPGYALSDFWEVYLSYAPFFANSERSIVKELASRYAFSGSKAKSEYGVELLWAPAYGKDSLGARWIIRSDTFFKVGVMHVVFQQYSGLKINAGIGKTFFLSDYLGFRPVVNGNWVQSVRSTSTQKKFRFLGTAEVGLVFYF